MPGRTHKLPPAGPAPGDLASLTQTLPGHKGAGEQLVATASGPPSARAEGRSNHWDSADTVEFEVEDGDLFVMWGDIQRHWKHGIEAQPDVSDPRLSATFRSTLKRQQRELEPIV